MYVLDHLGAAVTHAAFCRDFCLAVAEEAGILESIGVVPDVPQTGGTWPNHRSKVYRIPGADIVEPATLSALVDLLWSFPGVRAGFVKARMVDLWLFSLDEARSGPIADFFHSQAFYDIDAALEPDATDESAIESLELAVSFLRDKGVEESCCQVIAERLRTRLRRPERSPLPPIEPIAEEVQWVAQDAFEGVLRVGSGPPHVLRFSREWGAAAMALAVSAIARPAGRPVGTDGEGVDGPSETDSGDEAPGSPAGERP